MVYKHLYIYIYNQSNEEFLFNKMKDIYVTSYQLLDILVIKIKTKDINRDVQRLAHEIHKYK